MAGMVAQAPKGSNELLPALAREATDDLPLSEVQLQAARLYGQGFQRMQIARILADHIAPDHRAKRPDRGEEKKIQLARSKLRKWEQRPAFRDLIYQNAVVELDLKTPGILKGMAAKARHRVDAARLVLEVTGRHNPKGDQQPTNITVQIAHVPRPDA